VLPAATAARGVLVPVRTASSGRDLKAFALRAPEGTLRVCLINKDFSRGVRMTIDAGRSFVGSSVMPLSGPAADARAGITLGGAFSSRSNSDH
jgi:hypothetical protein